MLEFCRFYLCFEVSRLIFKFFETFPPKWLLFITWKLRLWTFLDCKMGRRFRLGFDRFHNISAHCPLTSKCDDRFREAMQYLENIVQFLLSKHESNRKYSQQLIFFSRLMKESGSQSGMFFLHENWMFEIICQSKSRFVLYGEFNRLSLLLCSRIS